MNQYKFNYEDKEYFLSTGNCSGIINDDEKPVSKIQIGDILNILNNSEEVNFDVEYYQEACPDCLSGVKEKQKFFEFLEYHFYIFTKNGEYVINNICKEYEGLSFNKLLRQKKVDDSYIVSLIICRNCNSYIIQIENCIV